MVPFHAVHAVPDTASDPLGLALQMSRHGNKTEHDNRDRDGGTHVPADQLYKLLASVKLNLDAIQQQQTARSSKQQLPLEPRKEAPPSKEEIKIIHRVTCKLGKKDKRKCKLGCRGVCEAGIAVMRLVGGARIWNRRQCKEADVAEGLFTHCS